MVSKQWNCSGTIQESRTSDDGQEVSFVILMENGRETIRHRSHLRHNIKSTDKVTETKVKFEVPENDDKDESDATDKNESTSESEKKVQVGVVTRSKTKQSFSPNSSALPGKSCLRARTKA